MISASVCVLRPFDAESLEYELVNIEPVTLFYHRSAPLTMNL